ncbi:MAG: TonB family protein [Kofleriaceae bacterium]|nr:TonB family protein [Kofleriaceae bacterium]
MPSVSVQLALLAVAKTPASADRTQLEVARDRALTAGHRVLATEVVQDKEAAIGAFLKRWVADEEIDAVIVLGGAESQATSRALAPLVTETIPGFADLFRWMMFQEKGAAAMLASAEAARCTDTFIFVIPGGVADAMDKLILPQFDPATTPRNLVAEMPRLRAFDSVPIAITGERTQGGPGLPARLPAKIAPKVAPNVVARDRNKSSPPADLRERLPKLPPGASEAGNDDVTKTANSIAPLGGSDDITKTAVRAAAPAAKTPANQVQLGALAAAADDADDGWDGNATLSDDEPDAGQTMDLDESDLDVAASTPPASRPITTPPPPPRTATPAVGVVNAPGTNNKTGPTKPPPRATVTPPEKSGPTKPPPRSAPTPQPEPRAAIDAPEVAPSPAKRAPTAPPPVRTSSNELPRGNFKYEKPKKKVHPALWVVGGLAVVALGFFGLIALFPSEKDKATEQLAAATPPAPSEPAPVPVEPAPVEPTPSAPTPVEPTPVEPAPIEMPINTARPAKPATPSNVVQRPVTSPETGPTTKPETGPTTQPETTPATKPETTPAAPAPVDDCDETSCVMSNYDRPCCARYKPTKTDFAPRVGGVPETLDKTMVRAGIEPVKPRVVKCGEQTKVAGTVRVSLSVSADGEVTNAALESSPDPALGRCVVEAMKRAKFGKTVNGATFTYPFAF